MPVIARRRIPSLEIEYTQHVQSRPGGGETEANPRVPATTSRGAPKLVVVRGSSAGRAFAMSRATGTVGRHPTNDLVVDDPRVSGVQLELSREGSSVRVRDVGSTNGTWLGPHRAYEVTLAIGGEIEIGDTVLRLENDDAVESAPTSDRDAFGSLVGATPAMRELFSTLDRIARKELSVLVQGETGTGKEEVARAIHAASARAAAPFVVIDATSLPETLAESLLFGHEKGAFTGAAERRIGFFEAASGGTVLIDEVGELPLSLQAKFLRVLERHEVQRVGSHTPAKVDVRVIAATNRDLRNEIDRGRFREDLYFRLAQVRVTVPPLRERLDDVPLLCRKILVDLGAEAMIETEALAHLASQAWPGNVRELKNALLRANALAHDDVIRRADVVGEGFAPNAPRAERGAIDLSGHFAIAKERAIDRFESAYLAALMRRCSGNLSRAAREADIARHHLRDLLKKRGLYGLSFGEEDS